MSSPLDSGFHLGSWEVQPQLNRIVDGGRVIQIEPKHMDVLVFLAGAEGEVKDKAEIIAAAWPEQFVADSVLTRAIAELRRALGDDAQDPRFIETITKRGYRVIAPVQHARRPTRWTRPLIAAALTIVILGAIAFLAIRWVDSSSGVASGSPAQQPRLSQLTHSPDVEIYPSFSPDGNSLAFSSNASGKFEIYVRQLMTGGKTLQLTDDGMDNLEAAWSPDGRWIAYHSLGHGGVWVVASLGSQARRLSEFGSAPAWSPDGRELVFQSSEVRSVSQRWSMPPSTLWRVAAGGGEPRPLTLVEKPDGGHGRASYSPDGRFVLFQASDFGTPGSLWMLDLTDSSARRVPGVSRGQYPRFDASGKSILYRVRDDKELWISRIDLRADGSFTEPHRLLRTDGAHLTVSPAGDRFAISVLHGSSHLWSVAIDPQTGEARGRGLPLNEATNRRNRDPVISPDGSKVAFSADYSGRPSMIWLLDLESRQSTELIEGALPTWSEDGRVLHFFTWTGLHRIELETREVEWVAPIELPWSDPRLSPDSSQVAFQRTEGGIVNVWITDIEGRGGRQVTFDDKVAGFPRWSPDSRQLAYNISRGRTSQISVIDLDSGETQQLTDEPGLSWPTGWSPDGDKIAFVGRRGGAWNIYWISRSTGEVHQVTDFATGIEAFVRSSTWSPLGDRIVFERSQARADLWLVELK